MYSSRVTQAAIEKFTAKSGIELDRCTIPEVEEWNQRLDAAYDEEAHQIKRRLTKDEERHIHSELVLSKLDYYYWVERYAFIRTAHLTLERVTFWESQTIALDFIAKLEEEITDAVAKGHYVDGIMLCWLKSRQLGASTICETIITHRAFFNEAVLALIGSIAPKKSTYLFNMMVRIYDNLPWWMRPHREYHVKGTEMIFDQLGTEISVQSANQWDGLGEGMTPVAVHISECGSWDDVTKPREVIDGDLLPAVPSLPTTFFVEEGTAKGRHNWLHETYVIAKKGKSRFKSFFVPWYAEETKYVRTPPLDWEPSEIALAHAKKVYDGSPEFCKRNVTLTKDQLYWWDFTRAEYAEKGELSIFLAEYAADDLSCFQSTNISVFDPELIMELRNNAKSFKAYEIITQ